MQEATKIPVSSYKSSSTCPLISKLSQGPSIPSRVWAESDTIEQFWKRVVGVFVVLFDFHQLETEA